MKDNNKKEKEKGKKDDKADSLNNENKNEIKIKINDNYININEEIEENKNEIIIEDNKISKEDKKFFKISFADFKSHYDNCESAIKNDVKNFKSMNNLPNNRHLLWLLFLGILPYKSNKDWSRIISDERTSYHEDKKKLITKDIENFIITKKIKDKYALYFKFKEILPKEDYDYLDIIKVDVTRTFQKIELFQQENIQKALVNILFIFAKNNKEIGYRQGMSDLCAIFLYVIYKQKKLDPGFIDDNISLFFYLLYSNNEFLESDTYSLFSKFMLKGHINFFLYNDEKFQNGQLSMIESKNRIHLKKEDILKSKDSDLKKRMFLVYYHEFPLVDKDLYKFMVDKIDPEIFMVRWYLCNFSREFPLPDLLKFWDLILYQQFLEDNKKKKSKNIEENKFFIFSDYIVLSMLINIKALIMKKKTSSELMAFLMKFPKNIELKNIYLKALEIYNKNKNNIKI